MSHERLKIRLEVTEAYPALLAMLLSTSEEFRGERIRALSMIGLHAESGVAPIRSAPTRSGPCDPTRFGW